MHHQQRWTLRKIGQRLHLVEPLVYRTTWPLPPFRYRALASPTDAPPVEPDLDDSTWPAIAAGDYWGGWETNFVLRTTFRLPDDWPSDVPLAMYLPLDEPGDNSQPEALIYVDGQAYAAIDRCHHEILLRPAWCDGRSHRLALHGWTGRSEQRPANARLLMGTCALAQIDVPLRAFIATARVALEVATLLDDNDPTKSAILNALEAAFIELDTREPFGDGFYDSVPQAHAVLRQGIAAAGAPLDVNIYAAGHAHLDVAWLWTLGQTRRKAGRTFHTVLRLMEQFPDYHFTQSQPQLYEFVRHDYPALFEAIKERVQEGRWEPLGGMWVEADCNLSGAESLARQFLLGRTFFREHLGPDAESPILWLPDVFGYAWNLPQLIVEAGLKYFFTIKISWSQYNRLPYDTFWWQGLDGTRVLTHFSPTPERNAPASTYNAYATPADVLKSWQNFQQKELSQALLMSFGFGDGGGGPTREMLENIREMASFPAMPRVHHDTALSFFQKIETELDERLPVWNGELYLEYHRGTYTTQSRNKRANRKSEFLLHDAEFLASYAALLSPPGGYQYPHDALRRAWELTCLNQFHDILPGSSIGAVYAESLAQYATIRELGERVRDEALAAMAAAYSTDLLLVGPTCFSCSDPAFWPEGDASRLPGGRVTQPVRGGLLLDVGEVPPYSVQPLAATAGSPRTLPLEVSPTHLENDFLRVELNPAGDITRLYDKRNRREVLPPGGIAGQFQAFEDRPLRWDAWDIDLFYDDKMWLAEPADSIEVIETGPLRASLEIKRRILNSRYTQRISLVHNSPRLNFETTIDWRERHILLKAAFPVDVLAPTATYEIQWGNVERPTHRNTSWDWARFETCAHKWVDLGEGDYGVSLLNDCKYGHDIQDQAPYGGRIRLSLLRSPTNPDPAADQGEHRFAYSLLPHAGRWQAETIAQAYTLNDPLLVFAAANPVSTQSPTRLLVGSLLRADRPNVVVETVKGAENGRGIIVRLYESQRQRGPVTLHTAFPLRGAWRANLLEEDQQVLPTEAHSVEFAVKPYGIVTLRLQPE
jgi:alpha-mannosidase